MKKTEHTKEADNIGADSWELQNFKQLPKNASAERQVEALRSDQRWINTHTEEISRRIDHLIRDISR